MAVQREGRWLVATRSANCAYEVMPGEFRLSYWPGRRVSGTAAVAGLALAEMAADWNELLWEEHPNTSIAWGLIGMHAEALGMDAVEAVARAGQYELPADDASWAVWTR